MKKVTAAKTTKEQRRRAAIGDQPFAPPYRRLSKAALSGPSVCLRARAPCPLRVSCPGADRAESCVLSRSVPCSGSRQAVGSGAPVPHPPGPRGRAARAAGLRSSGWLLGTRQVTRPAFSSRTDCSAKIDSDGVLEFEQVRPICSSLFRH